MKDKNDSVINIRLPEKMKKLLKEKLGYNMSSIMKEHFQKLLDVKENEINNRCWECHKQKKYDECSFAAVPHDDGARTFFIFCKDCLKKQPLDTSDDKDGMNQTINLVKQIAKENKTPEHLEAFSNLCHANKMKMIDADSDKKYSEISIGSLYFTNEFNLKMEEHINGESTQTHNS